MVLATWWRRARVDPARWVVVDVESSGLDPARDRLLAIAAVGVRVDWQRKRLALTPADSFEVVLRQHEPSERANVLLHGIGVQRQRAGVPAAQALQAFAAFAGESPLLAFHSAFDSTLIARATRLCGGPLLRNAWLDIEHLCGAAHPELRARSLDEWMGHFGIRCAARHQAAADAWAESEVLERIWPVIGRECAQWRDVERLAAGHRWLPRA